MDERAGVLILDGGLGTTLEDEFGMKFNSHTTPLWSSHLLLSDEGLHLLKNCQERFRNAGADILLTGTYQVSEEGFARTPIPPVLHGADTTSAGDENYGLDKETVTTALRRGIETTLRTRFGEELPSPSCVKSKGGGVALSLGPYGACMVPGQEYSGNYDSDHKSEDALYRWHLQRLELFTGLKGDEPSKKILSRLQYIAFETIPVLEEIRAVRRVVQKLGLNATPFWISCVFPNEDDRLPDGNTVEAAITAMLEGDLPRPFGIGMNCVKLYKLPQLIGLYESSVSKLLDEGVIPEAPTLVLYPDGTNGEMYDTTKQAWVKSERGGSKGLWADQMASIVATSRAKGVFSHFIVGGCCKARPADIQNLRAKLLG
ncbi:hypothetical protein KEM54_001051 [Ascosphaera aggregata]|nr:hypothetical protein KEM54_001051 [Ascosphaera aggregata]